MSVIFDPSGVPIEIAPGRGDLRYSSQPYSIRRDSGELRRIGKAPVSYGQLFATQPWISAAVMRLLTWAVKVPIKAYRRKDADDSRTRLFPKDHPLARMLVRPWLGTGATQAALIEALLGPWLVHGNSVIEIETVGGEEWFRPLDWRELTPLGPESGMELAGWRLDEGSDTRDIPISRSVHIAWWSPLGPLGVSPLEQLGVTISVEDAAQRYQQSVFGNSARPPSAITSSEEFLQLEKTDRQTLMDQLREDVEDIYTGPENAGKPAVLPPGLDWKPVGHSAVEAELISQRKISREEIAAVYQIPPPMIGILDQATYSNIEVQREMAYTMALGPPLALIEQVLTATLARDLFGESDLYCEFDFGPVLRGDRQKEVAVFAQGIATGLYTVNEGRRGLNMPPSDEEDAEKLWMPANNLVPLGEKPPQAAPQASVQQAAPPPPGEEAMHQLPAQLEAIGEVEVAGELLPVVRLRDDD